MYKLICDTMCKNPTGWAPGDAAAADRLAIRCALVRGGLDRDDNLHVWLLVRLPDDDCRGEERGFILDLTNGVSKEEPYSIIHTDSPIAFRYLPTTSLPVRPVLLFTSVRLWLTLHAVLFLLLRTCGR
jgi:hypothetical protein